MGAAIAAGIIAIAGTAYGAYSQNKARKDAAGALGGMQQLDLSTLPNPETVDWASVLRNSIGTNTNNLPDIFAMANKVNQFQTGQALRGYSAIQPYFKQNQELIGRNAASFARGELPSDVVSSIGRASAQRGIQGGFGMGLNSGGPGSALGSLNLRNLGLTSLELSKVGTGMAMDANSRAASMAPGLFDPSSMFISPGQALGVEGQNASTINRWNEVNTQIKNAEATGNTELLNSILEAQTGMKLQGELANAQAIQSASQSAAGIVGGGYFGGGSGGNSVFGQNNSGFYNTAMGAGMNANGGTVTNSPYGYAVRPTII